MSQFLETLELFERGLLSNEELVAAASAEEEHNQETLAFIEQRLALLTSTDQLSNSTFHQLTAALGLTSQPGQTSTAGKDSSEQSAGRPPEDADRDITMTQVLPTGRDRRNTTSPGRDSYSATSEPLRGLPPRDASADSIWRNSSGSWGTSELENFAQLEGPQKSVNEGMTLKGRFVLEKVLGEGGMGVVYKAIDLRKQEARDRSVYIAIKVLNDEFRRHPLSLIALQREARRSQDLAHPNIVNVFDFDRDGTTVFMTMEFLVGQPIDKILRNSNGEPFPRDEAINYTKQIAAGLRYAHQHDVIHSDLKPGNLFLTTKGVIKILDFGVARVSALNKEIRQETVFSASSLRALTPAYASVEMLEFVDPTPADDIFALGILAYEFITGEHPYNRQPATKALREKLQPKPIRGIKRNEWRAIQGALSLRKSDRFSSVGDFLQEFDSGSTSRPYLPLAAAMAVAVVVAGGVAYVPSFFQQRQVERLEASLDSLDSPIIQSALKELETLDPRLKNQILTKSRLSLIDFFSSRANETFDPEASRYDYQRAAQWIEKALVYFPDSKSLSDLSERFENNKNQLMNELDVLFNLALSNDVLVVSDGEQSVEEVLSLLAKIDPEHFLLSDMRLPPVLISVAEEATETGDFTRARNILSYADRQFDDDIRIQSALNNLANIERQALQAAEIARLESELQSQIGQVKSIDDLNKNLATTVTAMDEIAPLNRELLAAREVFAKLFVAELRPLIDQYNWDQSLQLVNKNEAFLGEELTSRLLVGVNRGKQRRESEIDSRLSAIGQRIDEGKLQGESGSAKELISELEKENVDAALIAPLKSRLAAAFINTSRSYQANGDWSNARMMIDQAASLETNPLIRTRMEKEYRRLDSAQSAENLAQQKAEDERKEDEIQQQVAGLRSDIDNLLTAPDFSAQVVLDVLDTLDQWRGLAPSDPAINAYYEKLELQAYLMSRNYRLSEEFSASRDWINEVLQLIPNSIVMQNESRLLQMARQRAEQKMLEDRKLQAQKRMNLLLSQPVVSQEWSQAVLFSVDLMRTNGFIGKQEEQRIRVQAFEELIRLADAAAAEQMFSQAKSALKFAADFFPESKQLAKKRESVAVAEQQHLEAVRKSEKIARVEGLKQSFITRVNALDVKNAESTLERLQEDAPDDPFTFGKGKQMMANAYAKLSRQAVEVGQYERAFTLSTDGLEFLPKDKELLQIRSAAITRQKSMQIVNYFAGNEGALGSVRKWLKEIAAANQSGFDDISEGIARDALGEVQALRQRSPDMASQRLAVAKKVFPSAKSISGFTFPKSSTKKSAREQQIDALLAESRQLSNNGRKADPGAATALNKALELDPENTAVMAERRNLERLMLTRYSEQLSARNFSAAQTTLKNLKRLGPDRTDGAVLEVQMARAESEFRAEEARRIAERERRERFSSLISLAQDTLQVDPPSGSNLEEATIAYEQAKRLYPGHPTLPSVAGAISDSYYTSVEQLLAEDSLEEAATLVAAGLKFDQSDIRLQQLEQRVSEEASQQKKKGSKFIFSSF